MEVVCFSSNHSLPIVLTCRTFFLLFFVIFLSFLPARVAYLHARFWLDYLRTFSLNLKIRRFSIKKKCVTQLINYIDDMHTNLQPTARLSIIYLKCVP